jgi:hypothetical protein
VLALQRAIHFRPIRLLAAAIALLGAGISEQLRLTSSRNDGRHQSESAIRAIADGAAQTTILGSAGW